MTLQEFITSKWGIFIAAFLIGMLVERWHVVRVRENQKALTKQMYEIEVRLFHIHNWLQLSGTPEEVLSKIVDVASIIRSHNREI